MSTNLRPQINDLSKRARDEVSSETANAILNIEDVRRKLVEENTAKHQALTHLKHVSQQFDQLKVQHDALCAKAQHIQ